MDKKKTAYQDIVDKIHYYINNPHKNPYDVFDYEGDEIILDSKESEEKNKCKPLLYSELNNLNK